jgi:hypothetical protein
MSIYTRLSPDDIVEANPTVITTGLWSNDTGSLEATLFTYSTQINTSGEYYLDAYNADPSTNDLAEVQFAVTYGHINGGGAPTLVENEQATLPTKAIYSQYRNLLLDPSDTKFTFEGVESDHIYVINFQRSRFKEQLDAGNWQLPLSGGRSLSTFIDDSGQTLGTLTANSKAGRVFAVVSGALNTTSGSVTASSNARTWTNTGAGYGLVYPDLGIIVLNPDAIGPAVGFYSSASNLPNITGSATTGSRTTPWYTSTTITTVPVPYAPVTHSITETNWNSQKGAFNHVALFHAINNAVKSSNSYDDGFRARSAESISSTHYFVRLRNKEYNYSNNPTFYNADNGTLIQSDFRNNPRVYVTTVGLYNEQNELLAVAKLSKPVPKSFDEEVLLRVRLDF